MADWAQSSKIDYLWKNFFNKSRQSSASTTAQFYEENVPAFLDVHANEIPQAIIPVTPPGSSNSIIKKWYPGDGGRIVMTLDRQLAGNRNWVAFPPSLSGTNWSSGNAGNSGVTGFITNFISPKYGTGYTVNVYDSTETQIAAGDNSSWVFNYKSGTLTFDSNRSEDGSTTFIFIDAYQYIGPTLSNTSNPTYSTISATTISANSITATSITTSTISAGLILNGQLQTVTADVNTLKNVQGNYAVLTANNIFTASQTAVSISALSITARDTLSAGIIYAGPVTANSIYSNSTISANTNLSANTIRSTTLVTTSSAQIGSALATRNLALLTVSSPTDIIASFHNDATPTDTVSSQINFSAIRSAGGPVLTPQVYAGIAASASNTGLTTYAGDLILQTTPAQGNLTERFRILSNGNVGIGTKNPLVHFHVTGSISAGSITGNSFYTPNSISANSITALGTISGGIIYFGNLTANSIYTPTSLSANTLSSGTTQITKLALGNTAIDSSAVMVASGQYFSNEFNIGLGGITLRDGKSFTADWNFGNVLYIGLLTGSNTAIFNNPKAGARYLLMIRQPTSGSGATVAWPSAVSWPAATAPTLTTATGKVDIMTFVYDSVNTKYYGISSLNFSST